MIGPSKLIVAIALLLQASQTVVPVLEEPRHHVKFENQYVRVIDALLPPGDTTLMHSHPLDNVPVVIAGGTMHTEVLGGAAADSTIVTGGAWFSAGGYAHRIRNTAATALRFIDVEILAPAGATGVAVPDQLPRHKLEVENARVRIYRVTLEPGETTGPHSHALPGLVVQVTGGSIAGAGKTGGEAQRFMPGQYTWTSAGPRPLTNAGTARYELVEIEWR